ncbi:LacI family DNA-binding transcriptional regulator [Oryzibacter oryziterrae]|uniref:LacI family DNA-binding transcriptional regulator n=1 Tax=Oryzibacter oryziterrae TaxID=2766474 RepID=UPI001F486872|nr:LacI family DNA-binding transcriptional regulator [Oryzibacter oryziterrae]
MTEGLRRKRAPRFVEIAREAGVSVSTVDRVLNERDSVSEAVRVRVIAAAERLGVPRLLPRTDHSLVHLDILLPDNRTPFFQRLGRAFAEASAFLDKRFVLHRRIFRQSDEKALLRAILEPAYRRHGLVIAAPDTAPVRAALTEAARRGETIAAVMSQLAGLEGVSYHGIDNYLAGRTAGLILGRFIRTSGRILFLSGGDTWEAHLRRVAGCRDVLTAFPGLAATQRPIETHDDDTACYQAVSAALTQGDVVGIYNSGEGSAGILKALERYDPEGRVVWITHELSDNHRHALLAGRLAMVIDQDPDLQAASALRRLIETAKAGDGPEPPARRSEFRLHFRENCGEPTL